MGEPHAAAGESQAPERVILGDMQCCHRSDTSFLRLETSLCMNLHIRTDLYAKYSNDLENCRFWSLKW